MIDGNTVNGNDNVTKEQNECFECKYGYKELQTQNAKLMQFLKDFEIVEAELIEEDECWNTEDGLPKWNERITKRFTELQTKRNELMYGWTYDKPQHSKEISRKKIIKK